MFKTVDSFITCKHTSLHIEHMVHYVLEIIFYDIYPGQWYQMDDIDPTKALNFNYTAIYQQVSDEFSIKI